MYAAHMAAGLALKGYVPKAPAWALLTGAFVPDFLWIAFARTGIEPTRPDIFFDDWSHSLLMVAVWGALFALPFWKLGRRVVWALWFAVFSHFLLDAPFHPKFLALYPHSSIHIGIVATRAQFSFAYWWTECLSVIVLSCIYVVLVDRQKFPRQLVAATLVLLAGLQLLGLS